MNPFLLTTAYFPPIAYFSCLKKAEVTYIEQYENFGKQSYRNRCEIMTANGVIALTVPVAKANSKTLIKDLKIVYPTPWQKLHFRGIESAYKNYLFDHNLAILTTILDFLKLKRDIRLTTDYIAIGDINYRDLRNAIHPKASHRQPGCDYIPKPYRQTFSDRFPFTPNLSILDLLFCCGPEAGEMI